MTAPVGTRSTRGSVCPVQESSDADDGTRTDGTQTPETDAEESDSAAGVPAPEGPTEAGAASAPSDRTRQWAPGATPRAALANPEHAFDQLYQQHAAHLAQQAFWLCGDRRIAERAVAHGFRTLWTRWPAVAGDPDPVGWARAAVHSYALSPWHRLRPGQYRLYLGRARRSAPDAGSPAEPELLGTLLTLPPAQRRCLLLHDGLGHCLPDTAAETEATTAATAARLAGARAALAEQEQLPAGPGAAGSSLTAGQAPAALDLPARLDRMTRQHPVTTLPAAALRKQSKRCARRPLLATLALLTALTCAGILRCVTG